ncbi:MAG: HPr family phosphocarrier protein [Chloroflexi bacterium]|nr:HPr family phosphocarrier protein [Chloroflexota bacterium]
MKELEIAIENEAGLHARPASLFVQTASQFDSDIQVSNVTRETAARDAKSAIGVMTLGVAQGHVVRITADGEDAEQAIEALRALIEGHFAQAYEEDEEG